MSRVGKLPVELPEGVSANIQGSDLKVKGPKGELDLVVHDDVLVKQDGNVFSFEPKTNSRFAKAMYATTRALVNNMVIGVSQGYTRVLEINGVGYRAAVQGKDLVLQLGFSHEVKHPLPEGVTAQVEKNTTITLTGIDKQLLGETAAKIRSYRPPEPYKGKGVKYAEERIIRKEGKKK